MDPKEILKFCIQNGLLVDEDVLKLFSGIKDIESTKIIIQKMKEHIQQNVITKDIFEKNKEKVSEFLLELPKENQEKLEKLKIRLGLRIEISKEVSQRVVSPKPEVEIINDNVGKEDSVKVLSKNVLFGKKYEVKDFVKHFRNRFKIMKGFLQDRVELKNLVSINKIYGGGQRISIIGLVSDKRITKNKNLLLDVEDPTGTMRVLVNYNKKDLYKKAEDISLDSVIGFSGSGSKEILFANEVIFPDSRLFQKKRAPKEEYALFLGDIQIGSKLFLEESFLKFIDYLNGKVPNTPEVEKIKYIFFVGDVVEGIGIFPKQEKELTIKDLEEQYSRLAELLSKIRKDIKIIISPGNHDGGRLMEPQPTFDEKYAWPLYNLKNVILVRNPASLNIAAKNNFPGFNVLMYHGFSYPYYANNVSRFSEQGDAMNTPTKIMEYLLKHRHLGPAHASSQQAPLEEDGLIIQDVPDIFVSGHTHKMELNYYNNILMISTATWEKQNKYQERMGNKPDFCKVPLLNLKTGQVKILDFEIKQEKSQEQLV